MNQHKTSFKSYDHLHIVLAILVAHLEDISVLHIYILSIFLSIGNCYLGYNFFQLVKTNTNLYPAHLHDPKQWLSYVQPWWFVCVTPLYPQLHYFREGGSHSTIASTTCIYTKSMLLISYFEKKTKVHVLTQM